MTVPLIPNSPRVKKFMHCWTSGERDIVVFVGGRRICGSRILAARLLSKLCIADNLMQYSSELGYHHVITTVPCA